MISVYPWSFWFGLNFIHSEFCKKILIKLRHHFRRLNKREAESHGKEDFRLRKIDFGPHFTNPDILLKRIKHNLLIAIFFHQQLLNQLPILLPILPLLRAIRKLRNQLIRNIIFLHITTTLPPYTSVLKTY